MKNTILAAVVKGGSLCLSLLTTPAFIRYFGDNAVLGVWYTLLSILTWFLNFDLGIGNGIRNHLVKDLARRDKEAARMTLSSGFFSNGVTALILTVVGAAIIISLDLNQLYNIDETIISAQTLLASTLLVFAGIMLRFFLTSVSAVFYALQMSSVNNVLALCVSVLQLGFVVFVKPENPEKGLLLLSAAYTLLANLPMVAAACVLFSTKMRDCRPSVRYVRKAYIQKVMGIGAVFFVCQISYMLLVNTNEFLISNLFGPQYTTEYTFYYRLTSLISMVISLALTPMWSAVTKAMAEKNYGWVNSLYRKLKRMGLAAVLFQFAFVAVQQFVMDLWLGEDSIRINYWTAVAFACFGGVFTYSSILSTIVCGMAKMKLQMICYTVGSAVKLLSVFLLAGYFHNWSLIVWINVAILFLYCVAEQRDLNRKLNALCKSAE